MTFESREESVEEGAPVELYTFRVYSTNYYYTSAATVQTLDATDYAPYAISHGEISQTEDLERNDLTLDVPLDFPILDFYEAAPPSDVIFLTVVSKHRDDTGTAVIWTGRVLNATREGGIGKIACENVFTSLRRMGLRRLYSRLCPHVLYGPRCRAVEATHEVFAVIDGVNGSSIDSTTFALVPDGRYAGGLIEYEVSPGRLERRGIKSHVGSTVEMTHPIPDLPALATVRALPGCKHTLPDCNDVFANVINYGGWAFVPKQNPMGSSSVF